MQKMPSMPSGRNRSGAAKFRKQDAGSGAGVMATVLVVVSLAVFTLSAQEGPDGFFAQVRGVVQTITSPISYVGAVITSPFAGLGNVFRNLTADEQTLSDLKAENEQLAARNVELEEARLTAERLQQLLDLRDTHALQSIAARVISGSSDSWTAAVTIDRGSSAGLAVGMPVATQTGAIGQIIACAATTSTVRLLTDEGSSISAMLQTDRVQGMLRGSVDGTLKLTMIRTDHTVDVGEMVVTSGLGGVFPKGLPLGKVASVESEPGSAYYEITVEPLTRIGNLEEVLVITSLTEAQQATEEDIASADAADLEAASGKSAGDLMPESSKDDDEEDEEQDGQSQDEEDAESDDQNAQDSDNQSSGTTTAQLGGVG